MFKARYVIIPVVATTIVAAIATPIIINVVRANNVVVPEISGDISEYMPPSDDIESRYEQIKNSDKDFTKLKPSEAIYMAYNLFGKEETTASIGVGNTKTRMLFEITQNINTFTVHRDNKFMEESISTGTINIYDRMYQEGNSTTKYWGENKDYSKDKPETVTNQAYEEAMGRKVSDPLVYVVSEKTVINEDKSGKGLSKISKLENGYEIDVELDPIASVVNYQKQMKTISDLDSYPVFHFCHLYVQTDLDLNLHYMTTYESYDAVATKPFKIRSTCTGSLTTVYLTPKIDPCAWVNPTDPLYDYPKNSGDLLKKFNLE